MSRINSENGKIEHTKSLTFYKDEWQVHPDGTIPIGTLQLPKYYANKTVMIKTRIEIICDPQKIPAEQITVDDVRHNPELLKKRQEWLKQVRLQEQEKHEKKIRKKQNTKYQEKRKSECQNTPST